MSLQIKQFYDFAEFRVDTDERVLLRRGKPLPLTPKAFQMLRILIEHRGRIVEKEKLMAEIWEGSFVEEGNLAVNASALRKALADDANQPRFIETIPRRGYRFIGELESAEPVLNGSKSIPSRTKKFSKTVFAVLLIVPLAIGGWFVSSRVLNPYTTAPILSSSFASEKFSATGNVHHAVLSPDGKYVAYTNETGGKHSIWLRNLEASENIQIIPPDDFAYFGITFSHDGGFLYFVRQDKDGNWANTYRVTTFGGIPVKIIDRTQGWISLSPDDRQISFVRCESKEDDFCSLMIADADGKNEQKILTRQKPIRISANQFSPDGRSIAFASGQSASGSSEFGLYETELAVGSTREITTQKFFDVLNLKWLPSGDSLLFAGVGAVNQDSRIWQVSKHSREVQPVTKDAVEYHQISLDKSAAKMIATQVSNSFRLYLANIDDFVNQRLLTAARSLTFTPDGKKIIYSADDRNIWTIDRDGGGQRQLTSDPYNDFHPQVSPNGRYIFFSSTRSGSVQVWRMNSDGTNQTQLIKTEGGYPHSVSPDGKWVYYETGKNPQLWRVSVDGVDEVRVSDAKVFHADVSPDGRLAAYFFRDTTAQDNRLAIGFMNLSDGKSVKTFYYDRAVAGHIEWLKDNRTIAFIISKDSRGLLFHQSLDDIQPRLVADLGEEEIEFFDVAPDGQTYGVIRGKWLHDAVLITGLN